MEAPANVKALTFDVFGTVLDLGSSLVPPISVFLKTVESHVPPEDFFRQWRARQRIEQFQDTIVMLGHSGYFAAVRRALAYTLGLNNIHASTDTIEELMQAWQGLSPFSEVRAALERLQTRYRLVVLSNGDPDFLDHLVRNRIHWNFDAVISSAAAGFFKPHPAVYRRAAGMLQIEVGQCLMVSANSFDVMGARASGFRAAFVNRYGLPYEDSAYRPDVIVRDFAELADALL